MILPPPLIYLLFLAAAWLLDAMLPIALPQTLWTRYIGWGLIDAGVLLMLWAGLLMLWRKTTVNPYGKPAKLLEEGRSAFAQSHLPGRQPDLRRHRLALGLAVAMAAAAPGDPDHAARVIMHEERLLGQLFGEDYRAYCTRVRRWL